MGTTPKLGIPELSQSQANPDITHNEALVLIQALLNGVIDRAVNAPPGSPAEGDAYILGAAPTGAWAGRANAVAIYWGGAWRFVPGNDDSGSPIAMGNAQEGLRVWVNDENAFYVWSGSPIAWIVQSGVTDGDKGDVTVSSGGATWTVNGHAITFAKVQQVAALSVIANPTNALADVQAVAAGTDRFFFGRNGTSLAFFQPTAADVANTPAGNIAATTVQAALNELDTEKVAKAGDTMSGKLTITASASLDLGNALAFVGAGVLRAQNASGTATIVQVIGDGASAAQNIRRLSADTSSPALAFQKGRGSAAAPSQVLASDFVGDFQALGYDDSGTPTLRSVARILFQALSNVTSTNAEGRMDFRCSANGSVTPSTVFYVEHATGLSMFGSNVVIDQDRVFRSRGYTVATLPANAAGKRAHVTDANTTLTLGIGTAVVGGGANTVPVFNDGAGWRIG